MPSPSFVDPMLDFKPSTTPDPAPPPVAPLAVTFAGVVVCGVPPFAWVPGLFRPEHHGRAAMDTHPVAGAALRFSANCPRVEDVARPAVQAATGALRVKLVKARDVFRAEDSLYAKWKALAGMLTELKARTRAVEAGPAEAEAKLRRALLAGDDQARAAEAGVREAVGTAELHRARVRATTAAEATARQAALAELARRLDAVRAAAQAEFAAEAGRLADEVTAYVGARLEALLVATTMAGRAAADPKLANEWGGGPDGVTGSLIRELP